MILDYNCFCRTFLSIIFYQICMNQHTEENCFQKIDTEMNSSWEHPANHSNTWQMEEVLSLGAISHISATISWPSSSLKIVQHRVSGVPCWQCERIQVKCELCGGQETESHQGSAGSGDWEEEQQRHININHVHQVSRCWNHVGKV